MATQGLALVGTVVGSALGGPVGGMIGSGVGSFVGSYVDQAIGVTPRNIYSYGPRLEEIRIQDTVEGGAIQKCFGRVRVSGQLIWASRFTEHTHRTRVSSGDGGGKGGAKPKSYEITYTYSCSFAVAVCEGTIIDVARIWVDAELMDLTGVNYRVYKGTETQDPDPKILATEGAEFTPAFRGVAYVVFEDIDLSRYGNRIPNLNFEVFAYAVEDTALLENKITALNIIPATGEYAYETVPITTVAAEMYNTDPYSASWRIQVEDGASVESKVINVNTGLGKADWQISMDDMQTVLPNIVKSQLVVSWFGTDLRMGNCQLKPKVEYYGATSKDPFRRWVVSGVQRRQADLVSQDLYGAMVGGTPSDVSVFAAITDLRERGQEIAFYPFIIMDIKNGNLLPDPYSNNASDIGQPAFPWRGRITVSPAPGYTGTVDKTATAATQLNTFLGSCTPSHFAAWNGYTIPYTGPNEFSYRRMILHYANLCAAAGGVDTFYIGTEMVQMMATRSATSTYPAVTAMCTLAAEVRAILGPSCKITYAADWSEWNGHAPADGTNDFHFHLDPLWADSNIDMVAIDNYMPLSDWRDTSGHIDGTTINSIYNEGYLLSNVAGGEGYDWYYASTADRDAQIRTPITDGAYGEPWIYRRKDLKNWWLNSHRNRPGGIRNSSTTAWVPQSKPIIFSELGCPAVDKGTNQPNVFIDPKSSESFLPYYSNGFRDDAIQRRFLNAHYAYWANAANNPVSTVYGQKMLDDTSMYLWTWDARPYPYFPNLQAVWRDSGNWALGHWLTGRMGAIELKDLVTRLMQNSGVSFDASDLIGLVFGYLIDDNMPIAEMLQPLMNAYFFDMYESNGIIKFKHRATDISWTITEGDCIRTSNDADFYERNRVEDTELPTSLNVSYSDLTTDYQVSTQNVQRLVGNSRAVFDISIPLAMTRSDATSVAETLMHELHLQRETLSLTLSPKFLALEPSDVVYVNLPTLKGEYRVVEVMRENSVSVSLVRTNKEIYAKTIREDTFSPSTISQAHAVIFSALLDLPMISDSAQIAAPWIAAYAAPWESVNYLFSAENVNYVFDTTITERADIGNCLTDVDPGPEHQWDIGTVIKIVMTSDSLELLSTSDVNVLNGANRGALRCNNGDWEIFSWVNATLVGSNTWELSKLLRGRYGTEAAMRSGIPEGAEFVLLDSLTRSSMPNELRGIALNWKCGPISADISDDSYRTFTEVVKGNSLKPLSVENIKATKSVATNMIVFSFLRRCRLPGVGDDWDTPLAEDIENYEADIFALDGVTVLRTLSSSTQSIQYSAAEQTADFGASITSVTVEIFQTNTLFGRGTGRKITLNEFLKIA